MIGTIPTGFGAPWWLALPIGAAVLVGVHCFLAKPVDDAVHEPEGAQA